MAASPAAGLVLIGLVPLVALLGDLAGRFQTGAGVWHDLILMLADGQIDPSLAVLGCVMAGAGVAIVAVGGGPPGAAQGCRSPIRSRCAAADVSRGAPRRGEEELPEEGEGGRDPGPPPRPAQPEPERDPRLWSKPRGLISPPPGSLRVTPWPSAT